MEYKFTVEGECMRCEKCGHEIMLPRSRAEKQIKNIIRKETD